MKKHIYTDMAVELRDIALEEARAEVLGGVESEEYDIFDMHVTWVKVTSAHGERLMGKPIGNYITMESKSLREGDIDSHENAITVMVDILGKIHNLEKGQTALVIGLGNENVSADALGPKVVSKLLVTRHIKEALPDALCDNVRPVAALSPGVMGVTGVETFETVMGLVERVKPDLVIAIDALASRSTSRINSTIQIADTGIVPGGGVGNSRKALNEENLGVKVISIGIPTVVDAATLANDTIDRIIEQMMKHTEIDSPLYLVLQESTDEEKYKMIVEMLGHYSDNMFVTPKNVDIVIDRLSNVIANAINIALHPGLDKDDINRYMY